MKILLVEDNDTDIQAFKATALAWSVEKSLESPPEIEECKTLQAALDKLSAPHDWDGIVLDLKLPRNTNGEEVLRQLGKLYFRIPVVVLSGTPAELDEELKATCLKNFIKAEQSGRVILDLLWDCKRTGLMKLIGGKGLFEQYLKTVFDKCIVPRFDEWRGVLQNFETAEAATKTQASLSRHILSCLQVMMQEDMTRLQPEECYLRLPEDNLACPRPGMILEDARKQMFLILNPACDLAMRASGRSNSDELLLVPIESERGTLKSIMKSPKRTVPLDEKQREKNRQIREDAYKNNQPIRFHWLPRCGTFPGGFVNFRKVITCKRTQFGSAYLPNENNFVVHPEGLKNIQSRFASYYARQGQPDIDFSRFSEEPIEGYI